MQASVDDVTVGLPARLDPTKRLCRSSQTRRNLERQRVDLDDLADRHDIARGCLIRAGGSQMTKYRLAQRRQLTDRRRLPIPMTVECEARHWDGHLDVTHCSQNPQFREIPVIFHLDRHRGAGQFRKQFHRHDAFLVQQVEVPDSNIWNDRRCMGRTTTDLCRRSERHLRAGPIRTFSRSEGRSTGEGNHSG